MLSVPDEVKSKNGKILKDVIKEKFPKIKEGSTLKNERETLLWRYFIYK